MTSITTINKQINYENLIMTKMVNVERETYIHVIQNIRRENE